MKHTKIIMFFLLCMLNIKAGYWEGTIGKSKIYLSLECDEDSSCSSRYFHESTLYDIIIGKVTKTSEYDYKLQVFHGEMIIETMILTKKSENLLIGIWENKHKKEKIQLNRIVLNNDDAFDKYRIKFLKYKHHKMEKLVKHKKELVWIEEHHSKTLFFRLGNGFSKTSREYLNPIFDKLQEELSIKTLTCSSPLSTGIGMDPIHARNTYLSDNLIEVEFLLNYFCGVYPDAFTERRIIERRLLDLHTGHEYELSDIITIGKDPIKLRELAFKAKGMPLKAKEKLKEDSYDPYDIEHWESVEWSYIKKGILIYLNFSSPERCFRGDNYLIPFELLKPYKNHLFKYKFGT